MPGHLTSMADYRKLRVWQKSEVLAVTVYSFAHGVKDAGHAELSDQMKRAAGSIGANIAEGSGHRSRKEFARFLTYAIASSSELENHVNHARNIHVIGWNDCAHLDQEISSIRKMLEGLRRKMV